MQKTWYCIEKFMITTASSIKYNGKIFPRVYQIIQFHHESHLDRGIVIGIENKIESLHFFTLQGSSLQLSYTPI